MLKILGRKKSSNVQKVLWRCGELGISFEREDVGGEFGRNRSPEYLALNPNAVAPTIDDGGYVLWESNAIVRYLAALHGMGTLYPVDLRRRAHADRWMDWQQTTVAPPMGILFLSMLKSPPNPIDAGEIDGAMYKAGAAWQILDAELAKHAFVADDDLTMGDIAFGSAVHRWFRLPIERPDLPHLQEWYARLRERPSYALYIATL